MYYDIKQSGERIRQLRVKSGLTQERVASALDIDRSFYNRIEAGKKGCSIDLLVQLSRMFHVSLDYLILGRYLVNLPETADKARLKEDIENLTVHLEELKNFL